MYTSNSIVTVGTHKNKELKHIPAELLLFIYYRDIERGYSEDQELFEYIQDNMRELKFELRIDPPRNYNVNF